MIANQGSHPSHAARLIGIFALREPIRRLEAILPRNFTCVLGMYAGLFVDINRNPMGGTIPSICGAGGDIYAKTLFHVVLMPAAHIGMLLGALLCVAEYSGRRAVGPVDIVMMILWQFGEMIAAEVGVFMFLAQDNDAILTMSAMAGIMLALGYLSGPEKRKSRKMPVRIIANVRCPGGKFSEASK